MEQFAEESPKRDKCFEKVLREVSAPDHPSRKYFICKSVILNNLHGVDIMKEAVEIARLRLFLRIVASVDMNPRRPNYGLEPLPDIDFNIRAGNTLVGFATEKELTEVISDREGMFAQEKLDAFKEDCSLASQAFERFKDAQLIADMNKESFRATKQEVTKRLGDLSDKLNRYLASVYDINPKRQEKKYEKWLASHQPFHWFAEFYGIVADRKGFDVIIGNPPYVEYSKVKKIYSVLNYKTERCGNLYALSYERVLSLTNSKAGLIIPIASVCTEKYVPLLQLLRSQGDLFISNFNDRPGKLFEGLEHIRLNIVISSRSENHLKRVYNTRYIKWYSKHREFVFPNLFFTEITKRRELRTLSKIGSDIENTILLKLFSDKHTILNYLVVGGNKKIYYNRKLSNFVQILTYIPKIVNEKGDNTISSEIKEISFDYENYRDAFLCLYNSNLFNFFLTAYSDCRHLNKREIESIPFYAQQLRKPEYRQLKDLSAQLMRDIKKIRKKSKSYIKNSEKR